MRTIPLALLLAVSLAGVASAQQSTGEKTEQVKNEITKLEQEKLEAFRSTAGGPEKCEDWVQRYDAEGIIHVNADGSSETKAELLEQLRSRNRKADHLSYGPQHILVYGDGADGTTAVTTYIVEQTIEMYGKRDSSPVQAVDVWVKRDGKWWFAVHSLHPLPPQK
jgi:hypothetical protein